MCTLFWRSVDVNTKCISLVAARLDTAFLETLALEFIFHNSVLIRVIWNNMFIFPVTFEMFFAFYHS
jgi:hypothetical protein